MTKDAEGKGVRRLLLIQQQINLLCIPAILIQLTMVANPSRGGYPLICLILEVLYTIVAISRAVSDLAVASGRYGFELCALRYQLMKLFIFSGSSTSMKFCSHTSKKKHSSPP